MEIEEMLGSINYLAVLVSALSSFVIGLLWYSFIFRKKWMKLNGFTEDMASEETMTMPVILITNYLATVLAAFALALFLGDNGDMRFGIFAGFMIAVFWIATNRLNDVLYERKPFGLFLINSGYNLVIYIIMGAILGAWH